MKENNISEIGQVAITVENIQKSLVFYRDILGLRYLFSPSEHLAFLQCGVTRIMLSTPQGAGEIGKNSILYFKTTHIEDTFRDLVSQGADKEREPQMAAKMEDHELWIGFLRDPDSNLVGIMEEKSF